VTIAPVAASSDGHLALLSASGGATGTTVEVWDRTGRLVLLPHESAVSALIFSGRKLIVGTRNGELFEWDVSREVPVREAIGRHATIIRKLQVGERGYVLAIDGENIIRLWRIGHPASTAPMRGYMEIPMMSYGIAGLDYLGAKGLGLSDDLVIMHVHAGGTYVDLWKFPPSDQLASAAGERLGQTTKH
jgi:hypothetical protein